TKIFNELIAGTSSDVLGTDNNMLSDPDYGPFIRTFAANQTAFFAAYKSALTKCINLNQLSNLDPKSIRMPVNGQAAGVVSLARRGADEGGFARRRRSVEEDGEEVEEVEVERVRRSVRVEDEL
ncbi:hypothetical protein BDK51DRAFT_33960, partial [Blyttiomyces helicus]